VIQDFAADLIKLAMIAIHRRIREQAFESKMLLQIHDALVFEVAPEQIDTLAVTL
jgi:DNA polymerase-1